MLLVGSISIITHPRERRIKYPFLVLVKMEENTSTSLFSACIASGQSFLYGLNLSSIEGFFQGFTGKNKASTTLIGAANGALPLGALFSNLLVNKLPFRKKMILGCNGIFFLIGYALLFTKTSIKIFIGRLFIGIGSGTACALVPAYLSSISTPSNKGSIGTLHQFFNVFGVICGQIIYLPFKSEQWKYPLMLQIMIVFIFMIPAFFIDEGVQTQEKEGGGVLELLKLKSARLSLVLAIGAHLCQQLSGINGILSNLGDVFKDPKVRDSEKISGMVTFLVAIASILGVTISLFVIDIGGRKPLLLLSSSSVALCLAVLAFGKYKLVAILSYVLFFMVGLGPVPWIMPMEIFPPAWSSAAVTLSVTCNWIGSLLVMFSFVPLKAVLKDSIYLIFSTCMFFGSILFLVKLKETKNKAPGFQ